MKKKFLCLFLTLLLFASVLPGITLFAEQEAPFTMTVTTQDGTDPVIGGHNKYKLNLKFVIASRNAVFGNAITFDRLEWANGSLTLNKTVSAEENKLILSDQLISFREVDDGKTVTFRLYWHTEEESNPEPLNVDFKLIAQDPSLTVRAVVQQTSVAPGSDVTILYEAQNIGNVPVQYVTIYDDDVCSLLQIRFIDTMEREADRLAPGETFSKSVTLKLDSTLKIKPYITYFYEKRLDETGEETQIAVNEILPTVSLTCETYSVANKGDTMHFSYTIHNTSPVPLTNVRVYDADSSEANLVNTPFDLDPDAVFKGSFDAVITRSGFYKFKVNYTYEGADGDLEISAKTERSIRIPSEVSFKITGISPNTISEPGNMVFSLTVENAGSTELTDLSITEENGLMEPLSLNIIIPGSINGKNGELTRSVTVHIPTTGTKLKFNLGYRIDGEYATTNTTYTVDFDQPLQTPETSESAPTPAAQDSQTSSTLYWILFGLLLLLLIAGAIVFLLILRHRFSPDDNRPVYRRIDAGFDETDEADYLYNDPSEPYDEEAEPVPQDDNTDEEGVRIYNGTRHE
ncbi:MAG: hypothetical protein J6X30_03360 [Clostridia bacterium]|nr:hypothetical protein [Clostridia bacterium]